MLAESVSSEMHFTRARKVMTSMQSKEGASDFYRMDSLFTHTRS